MHAQLASSCVHVPPVGAVSRKSSSLGTLAVLHISYYSKTTSPFCPNMDFIRRPQYIPSFLHSQSYSHPQIRFVAVVCLCLPRSPRSPVHTAADRHYLSKPVPPTQPCPQDKGSWAQVSTYPIDKVSARLPTQHQPSSKPQPSNHIP